MLSSGAARFSKMAIKAPPEVLLRPLFESHRLTPLSQFLRGNNTPVFQLCTSSMGKRENAVKTVMCRDFASPLTVEYVPLRNELQKHEVCIDIHYAAVNFADILVCKGKYQSVLQPPFSPGMEYSGIISKIGSSDIVQKYNLNVGDKVVAVAIATDQSNGGYAEKTITSAENVYKVPGQLSLDRAAAIPTTYGTALLALQRRARIKPGDKVLVTAAAGAVGLAAVDIAKLNGASVYGACGSSEKCALLLERGAALAINYSEENVKDRIKHVTNGRGVDITVDCVGGKLFPDLIKSLSPEGRLVVIGFTSGSIGDVRSNLLLLKNCDIIGVWWGQYNSYGNDEYREVYRQTIKDSIEHCANGHLIPHIGSVFTVDEINQAMQYIMDRKSTGKVLLKLTT